MPTHLFLQISRQARLPNGQNAGLALDKCSAPTYAYAREKSGGHGVGEYVFVAGDSFEGRTAMGKKVRMTGGEIVTECLIRNRVPYAMGIPGHGCLALVDAFARRSSELRVIQVKQEMSAVHMADGYYRVTGRPLAVFTSIGPGAINTAIGVATCYVDSTAVLVITGATHTHMVGKGVLQEIERSHDADFPSMLAPVVKRYWRVTDPGQLPSIMQRSFNLMTTGRPGPVLIDLPMDVQADSAEVELDEPGTRVPLGKVKADQDAIKAAARLLAGASRAVILAGGGVRTARAYQELKEVAEHVGAAVVETMMGKGVFPADHPLFGMHAGSKGTTIGNKLTSTADVLLAVGCRFADETTSSYRRGVSFSIPPTKLVHIDIDSSEIGKNYPVEIGIVADAKSALSDLLTDLREVARPKDYGKTPYFAEIQTLRKQWWDTLKDFRESTRVPVTISRMIKEIREFLDRDAIVVSSSGNVQAQLLQEFPILVPGTNITSGGFSTMGFSLPASLGVKLAMPDRQVIALIGDGDFMMTMQELATAVQYDLPVVVVIANNAAWMSIQDLQMAAYGKDHAYACEFVKKNGEVYTPDFASVAKAFGSWGTRIQKAEEIKPALKSAFSAGKPAVIEVMVNREFPYSGGPAVGWWDVPIPTYMKEKRAQYEAARAEEDLT